MNNREILKHPAPPKLTKELIGWLTDLCFYEKEIESAQLLFVFGSNILHEEIGNKLTNLLREYKFKTLLITGGVADYHNSFYENIAESELILKWIPVNEFKGTDFIIEKESRNTLENVVNANTLFPLSQIETVAFISHSYASMRSYLTLKKFCKAKSFFNIQIPIHSNELGVRMTKDNWHITEQGKSLVWGEYLRFATYGVRGDFPIDDLQLLLNQIADKIDI